MESDTLDQPTPSAPNGEPGSAHNDVDPALAASDCVPDQVDSEAPVPEIKPIDEPANGAEGTVPESAEQAQVSTENERLKAVSVEKSADRPKDAESRRSEDRREDRREDRAEKTDRRDRDRDRERDKDRDRDRDREKDRDKDRDRDKHRSRSKDLKESKPSRSRSRDKSKKRSRTRSRSKDRKKRHSRSRSRSRDRRRSRRTRSRSRSPSRGRNKHSESPSKGRSRRSSSADYGGYVPRKRQGDPPSRSEYKREHRDREREREREPVPLLSSGAPGGYSSANDPFFYLRNQTAVPSDPQEALRAWQEQQLRARQLVLQQQAASAAAAASKTQREVYVGNLVAGLVTDAALKQVFNSALSAAFPGSHIPGMEPVVNVSMHSDGRYAFVELRTPEMATAALQLSGQVQLLGQPITVGRPSGYVDPIKAQQQAQQASAALLAFQAGDTSVAAAVLGTAAPPGIPALMSGSPAASLAATSPGSVAGASSLPTEFLCVTGMVTPDVLVDEQEYRDVQDDLREECSKYGLVVEVKVPRPSVPAQAPMLFNTGNFGKAFVRFADSASCVRARDAVHGRMFAGNVVNATFITPPAYASV